MTLRLAATAWLLRATALVALVLPRWPVDVVLFAACVVGLRSLRVVTVVIAGRRGVVRAVARGGSST